MARRSKAVATRYAIRATLECTGFRTLKTSDDAGKWRIADIWNGRAINSVLDTLGLRTTGSNGEKRNRDFDGHQGMIVLPGVVVDNIILKLGN